MPKPKQPRHGSMQFWPRKRAKRIYSRVSTSPVKAGLHGFAGYKAGMTQVQAVDARKNVKTKGDTISIPVTVIECPPLRIAAVRCYARSPDTFALNPKKDIFFKTDKELIRKTKTPKKIDDKAIDSINLAECADIALLVYTQPKLAGVGKKKPELFELRLGGTNEEKLAYVKEHVNKDLLVSDVFKEGDYVDVHGVTTGKGYQGPVKRFGIGLKSHKSEKGVRRPGSLGGWKGQAHFMYRVAMAGQLGFFKRTEYNKHVLKIVTKPEDVNPKGGFVRYGVVRGNTILLKGSIPGPKKRLIIFTKATRLKSEEHVSTVDHISTASQQGTRVKI